MKTNRRYTIMPFPQGFDGKVLKLNLVLIPRNMDPFSDIDTGLPAPLNSAQAFADFQPQFEAAIVKGLDEFPLDNSLDPIRKPIAVSLNTLPANQKKLVLQAIAKDFVGKINLTATDQAPEAKLSSEVGNSVKKYLPESYRNAFNFTSPRHNNARTDDSYHCIIRNDTTPVVKPPTQEVSWGQLYAHILRQPLMAKACGMVYSTEIVVDPSWFDKGGYLYINLMNELYKPIQTESLDTADEPFIKRYAARIPPLTPLAKRPVFAPLLFPVLYRKPTDSIDPAPQNAPWDEIFPEVNEYNDGFAKIVHANQPVSQNLLQEQKDGIHPQKDVGIRMGWDDEQILIWYIRQLTENPNEPNTKKRTDAPLGVFGFCIDVKENGSSSDWESLNRVRCKAEYTLHDQTIGNKIGDELDLPFQVYPTQPDGTPGSAYWLPMYFGNWLGKSMVMKDNEAAQIYQNDTALDGIKGASRTVGLDQLFEEVPSKAQLLYGNTYQFRIRFMDISGGTPDIKTTEKELNLAPSPTATVHFKRYVAPGILRIDKPVQYDRNMIEFFNQDPVTGELTNALTIQLKRPILGYPAVVFTHKYQAIGQDPIALLIAASKDSPGKSAFGLADPDVGQVEVRVEVETLGMDNAGSKTGKENYATLYTTYRNFPLGFDDIKSIPVKFIDSPILNFDDRTNPFNDDTLKKSVLDSQEEIILPTARRVRVSLRAICAGDDSYFGFTSDKEEDNDLDSRYGSISQLLFYKESTHESNLLIPKDTIPPVQALYLQADEPFINNGNLSTFLLQRELNAIQPDIVQRLATQIGAESKGLTLVGPKGTRVVFGCSNRIKHTLSPDHSSITFASKADLIHHWIGVLTYKINRDWTWDALEDVSFKISRHKKFSQDSDAEAEDLNFTSFLNEHSYAGDIEIKHTVSFDALQPDTFGLINRDFTELIFIDAIEPKTGLTRNASGDLRFPDQLLVDYGITPQFKLKHASNSDKAMFKPSELLMPTTVNPVQIPKLVSVGIAFSPYKQADKYQSTEARKKYLWLEFEEPVQDPNDTLFCRLLAYSPDQLISNNHPELLIAPAESPLDIDPEFVRKITPGQSDDLAGLGAMQVMEKASDSDVHYLLPIPSGMNSESPELFGFFTYEFRIGHGHWSDRKNNVWSTAQGRFSRPLRVTGLQHPAPNLLCTVNRNDTILYVNAPYAKAVFNGKNVTSKPPRTQLWCLLYTQVRQADGKAYRNILLDEKIMKTNTGLFDQAGIRPGSLSLFTENINTHIKATDLTNDILTVVKNKTLIAGATEAIAKDDQPFALAYWENAEIIQLLNLLGLPTDGPLSVLVVEVFGNITRFSEHVTDLGNSNLRGIAAKTFNNVGFAADQAQVLNQEMERAAYNQTTSNSENSRPLSSNLGQYRILRTSPLTEVPFVCCTDC